MSSALLVEIISSLVLGHIVPRAAIRYRICPERKEWIWSLISTVVLSSNTARVATSYDFTPNVVGLFRIIE
jgi:hypothetical protein